MEAFLLYLLKSSGILFLFWCCYQLFLKKETFFTLNRWFLLTGMLACLIIPLLYLNKTVWVEYPLETITRPLKTPITIAVAVPNWSNILFGIYVLGVGLVMLKLVLQLFSFWKIVRQGNARYENGIQKIETEKPIAPFSFLNFIVYHNISYNPSELKAVLAHEEAHIKQRHSMDILWAHLFIAFQWFNPFAWWYLSLIRQNHEFIADRYALQVVDNKKGYQYLLLKNNMGKNPFSFAHPFFNSLLKKRIIMLNKNTSSQRNLWKYGIIALPLIAFVMLFQTRTIAQQKKSGTVDAQVPNKENLTTPGQTAEIPKGKNGKNPLYILDGMEVPYIDVKTLHSEEIESITVWKGEKAISLYGDKAKEGAIVIKTKSDWKVEVGLMPKNPTPRSLYEQKAQFHKSRFGKDYPDLEDVLILVDGKQTSLGDYERIPPERFESSSVNYDSEILEKHKAHGKKAVLQVTLREPGTEIPKTGLNPLIVIDGQKSSTEDLDEIDRDKIASMNVLKGETAIKKYGDKAKHGVIEIETKEN
ncbi:MAG: M56 family metallopeptidase [Bacteroidota bacterium]